MGVYMGSHWPKSRGAEQIFARAKDSKHQKRLSSIMDVVAMVPTLPEDSIIVSLPFGGAVLRSLGCTADEVNALLEDTRKKFVMEKGEWQRRRWRRRRSEYFAHTRADVGGW